MPIDPSLIRAHIMTMQRYIAIEYIKGKFEAKQISPAVYSEMLDYVANAEGNITLISVSKEMGKVNKKSL